MKKIWNFLKNFVIIAYILLIIFVTICLLSYNKYKVTVFGKNTFLPVIDDDLEPDYKYGDLLIINKNNLSSVREGDIVFFYRTASGVTTVNYAKVVKNERVNDTETTFTVEGGFAFSSSYFIGKAETTTIIPKAGKVIGILESKWGFLFLGVFPSLIAFLYTVHSIIIEVQDNDDDEEDEKPKKKKSKKKKKNNIDGKNTQKSDMQSTNEENSNKENIKEENNYEEKNDIKTDVKEINANTKDDNTEIIEKKDTSEEVTDNTDNIEKTNSSGKTTSTDDTEKKGNDENTVSDEKNVKIEEKSNQKKLTEEQRKALIQAKLNSMTEEEKKALIQAKLNSMTDEQKRALIEAKKRKMQADNK